MVKPLNYGKASQLLNEILSLPEKDQRNIKDALVLLVPPPPQITRGIN
jgi:hypothetical protein